MCAFDFPININPDGSKWVYGTSLYMVSPSGFDPFRNLGSSCSPLINNGSNPINAATGNKYQQETDYWSQAGLLFRRNYNSLSTGTPFNKVWLTNFDRYVRLQTYSGSPSYGHVFVYKASGNIHVYKPNGGGGYIPKDASSLDKLERLAGGGWRLKIESDDSVENYDVNGKILTITDRASRIQTLTYDLPAAKGGDDDPDTLDIITDDTGRSLRFTYDTQKRIATITDPAGGVISFSYDTQSNLISATYPDGRSKTYHYNEFENTAGVYYLTHALTGITDENGDRFATFTYDAKGLAITSEHAGGANRYSFTYNANRSSTVADPLGAKRTYNFKFILGVVKSTGVSQPGGSGCNAAASATTYDVNGNVASRTDFNGNKTTYIYDLARNLETSRIEGLTTTGAATTATRTITTTWHPVWRLPLVVSAYNGASATGTALRTTTAAYDDKGNNTSVTEADPINNINRTTSTSYTYSSSVPGLMLTKVVDGPRTDVSDITTYNYTSHDATCTASAATPIIDPITSVAPDNLGCRGQLSGITNALNQTTTYDRYNHHGQVEQMTDANGLVTTNTYDLRQRLLTRTVGTETTTLVYDNVGQVIQLNLPDNSHLSYTYDAAHRLTDIQDNLGNKIHYTLDSEGNRLYEDTTDPTNQLTKTLTRNYDALNRLQQVSGIE
ncbi:MAG: DUF6531 domain-containing protein [Candidatus Nitrotoga sp.]